MRAGVVVLALFLAACGRTCGTVVPDPQPGGATCAEACTRLEQLRCDGFQPTPEGASCAEVCKNVVESGVIRWNLDCRTQAETCAAVDECER